MFDELRRQMKRTRAKTTLAMESRRHAAKKTGQARISPQFVQVTEDYRYRQSVGRWQPVKGYESGLGTISVATSIDAKESLATPGRLDLRALNLVDPDRPQTAGSFLTFHNHGLTDLERLIAVAGGFDSVELRAPAGAGRPSGQAPEVGLRKSHQRTTYRVEQPSRLPIEADLVIAEGKPDHPTLEHKLYLLLDVKLHLPNVGHEPTPRLLGVEFDWPWLAEADDSIAIRTFRRRDDESPRGFDNIDVGPGLLAATYDTSSQAIVCWPNTPEEGRFVERSGSGDKELAYLASLLIEPKRPFQLIDTRVLKARVWATFDSLLSGTEVRLHHATGYLDESTPVDTATSLRADIELDLEQAMAKRLSEQRNLLRFPGVLPSDNVVETIRATVLSCGYRLLTDDLRGRGDDGPGFGGRIRARRLVEGTSIDVVLQVGGRNRRVDRTLRGAGGPRLKEELEAGDVDIELHGSAEGNHRLLTSEMNTLHANLRSRLSTFVEA